MRLGRRRILIVSVVVSLVLLLSPVGAAGTELSGSWTKTTSYPTSIYLQSCAIYSSDIYCVGGVNSSSVTDAVYYASVSPSGGLGSPWTQTTSYPTSIYHQSCVIYSSDIYCVGGYTDSGVTNAVYYAEVSPSGVGSWTQTTSYPLSIYGHSCAIYSDYIYCVGGYSGTSGVTNAVYYAEVSPSGGVGTWTLTTSYPTSIYLQSCAIYSSDIYCVGGSTLSTGSSVTDAVYYASVSPSGVGSWTQTTSYPTSIEAHSCATYSGHIYCVGGSTGSKVIDAVYYASVSSSGVGSWASTYSYPIDIYYQSCAIYFGSIGYIYCVGGYDGALTGAVYYAPLGPPALSIATSATTPLPLGSASATDTVTLTNVIGTPATGSVIFTLYATDNAGSCSGSLGTATSGLWTSNGGGSWSASGTLAHTFSTAGTYYWVASYAGDANNAAAGPTACGATGETLTVGQLTPTLSTVATTPLAVGATSASDTAILNGAFNPTGPVTFTLYVTNTGGVCSGVVATVTTNNWSYSAGGYYIASGTVTYPFNTPGTYYWVASFAGDATNTAATASCGTTGEVLNIAQISIPEFPSGLLALALPVLAVYLLMRYGIRGRGKTVKSSLGRSAGT
jgi:hypothetical protein